LLAQFRSFEAVEASTKENLERNPGVSAQIVRLSSNWDHKLVRESVENLRFEDRGSICAQFSCRFVSWTGAGGGDAAKRS
jgi:hypothetical protein